MPRKEFVRLIEENILILDKLGDRLRTSPISVFGYSRQQLATIVRLHMGGRAKLKDIARREFVTTPNLCACFRKLERDGLVERTIDENDRRNTWYSLTVAGQDLAHRALDHFRESIERLFGGVNKEDEARLIGALKTMNELLSKMEINKCEI